MDRPRVLISEPSAPGEVFLPYVWAVLKSYWERHGSVPDAFTWLEPLYLRETVKSDLDAIYPDPPDVVGLSCYTWNWALNCKVAQWAKERNPNCVVVAGGPDPDYKDPDFFRKHSYIDMIVLKDGEIPFTRILETVLKGERDFRHIPGMYLPSPGPALRLLDESAIVHLYTGNAEVPTVFDDSPYLLQSETLERIMAERRNKWTMAMLETNRGCPYSCSYCDWGSSTMSKVRRFEISRIEAEIDWIAKNKVNYLFLGDANFGLFPRDVEIADRLAEAKQKYGFPKGMYYSSAKNNPDRTVEISRRFYEAKLTLEHVLSVQHTDPEVLAATDRANISAAKYREVVAQLATLGIPSEVQLILGIPGDTVEKWKNCLADMMDWGIHENFQVSPYALLPNAPAAEPKFRKKWQMETVERGLIPYGGIRDKNNQTDYTKSNIVVAWSGFTRADWVEVSAYSAFVRALHNRAITRLPAMYLWFVHGVPYREFYDAIIDDFIGKSETFAPIYKHVRAVYEEFLRNPDATDELELEDFPDCNFLVDPTRWILVKICLQLDSFYKELSGFLLERYPRAKNLRSVIQYQKNLVVTPDYSSQTGKSFPIDRDWPAFFNTAHRMIEYRKLEEPTAFHLPRIAEIAEEDRIGADNFLDFGNGAIEARWNRWLKQVVRRINTAQFSNFPPPQIRRGLKLPFQIRPAALK